jgi:redox-sensitive bicupin YhaK (pirin superfamily)
MIDIRPYKSLGGGNHGWLNTRHHFSFAGYHDEERMSWGPLRVWNDDEIAAGAGFPAHPHANMEIITYVRQGAITHGDVQVMSAGSGIRHAEYNLESGPTTIFQIWIMPNTEGGNPVWGAKSFPKDDRAGKFVVLASGIESDADALRIRSDARVLGVTLKAGQTASYPLGTDRRAYLVPASGLVEVNGALAHARDGVAVAEEETLEVTAIEDSEIVMVDAP